MMRWTLVAMVTALCSRGERRLFGWSARLDREGDAAARRWTRARSRRRRARGAGDGARSGRTAGAARCARPARETKRWRPPRPPIRRLRDVRLNSSIDRGPAPARDRRRHLLKAGRNSTPRHFAPHPRALPTRLTPHRASHGRLAQLRQGGRRRRPGLGAPSPPPLARSRPRLGLARDGVSRLAAAADADLPAVSPPPRPPPPRPPPVSPPPTIPPPDPRASPVARLATARTSPATTVATSSRATTATPRT